MAVYLFPFTIPVLVGNGCLLNDFPFCSMKDQVPVLVEADSLRPIKSHHYGLRLSSGSKDEIVFEFTFLIGIVNDINSGIDLAIFYLGKAWYSCYPLFRIVALQIVKFTWQRF